MNNNCSTGSTALYLANNAVRGEQAECALALGFERMAPGSLGTVFRDRPSPMGLFAQRVQEIEDSSLGANKGPPAAVLRRMTPEQRKMDKVARSLSEVGWVFRVLELGDALWKVCHLWEAAWGVSEEGESGVRERRLTGRTFG